MAWDTEQTRRRLQQAATVEFAAHGPDGTTMSQIAERAGINKERLYNYFGDKDSLFATVLSDQLAELSRAVGAPSGGFEHLGEFAGRSFDYYAEHPELARLLLWEGLTRSAAVDEADRTAHYRDKVAAYREAQDRGDVGDRMPADHLVFLTIALAAWWASVPQLAAMITGAAADDAEERARRRSSVVQAAEQLAHPTD